MTEEIKKLRFEAAIGYAKIVDDTLKDYPIDLISEFIGINKKEYNYKIHYQKAAVKMQIQLADLLLAELGYNLDEKSELEKVIEKTETEEDEYKGTDLEGFPPEVVEWMLENQVKQGNKEDVDVFKNNRKADVSHGGFYFGDKKIEEGLQFCIDVIYYKRFDVFFEKYPKK